MAGGAASFGISADAFTLERILELVGESMSEFLRVDPETARRRNQWRRLEGALKEFLLYKVLDRPDRTDAEPTPGSS